MTGGARGSAELRDRVRSAWSLVHDLRTSKRTQRDKAAAPMSACHHAIMQGIVMQGIVLFRAMLAVAALPAVTNQVVP